MRPSHHGADRRPLARLVLLGVVLLTLGGCLRGCTSPRPPIHLNPNMDRQPKFLPQEESGFFYDGKVMRPPVPGTLARGKLREDEGLVTGKSAWGSYLREVPLELDDELLARGGERYGIYCAPCHGERGDGDSVMRRRGGVEAADLLEERFRQMAAGQLFATITDGKGLMPGYAYPIPVEDRWAIVAHLRRLQGEGGG